MREAAENALTGKLLAIDPGLARIGLAVCDPLQLSVRPLTTVERRSRNEDFALLAQLVTDQEVAALVCGLPFNMDGSEGAHTRRTRKWAMRLAHALRTLTGRAYTIVFWDERLTTFAANQILQETAIKAGEDAVAAAVILQSYLDGRANGRQHDGVIDLPDNR